MPEQTELEQLKQQRQKLEQKVMAIELEKVHLQDESKTKFYII